MGEGGGGGGEVIPISSPGSPGCCCSLHMTQKLKREREREREREGGGGGWVVEGGGSGHPCLFTRLHCETFTKTFQMIYPIEALKVNVMSFDGIFNKHLSTAETKGTVCHQLCMYKAFGNGHTTRRSVVCFPTFEKTGLFPPLSQQAKLCSLVILSVLVFCGGHTHTKHGITATLQCGNV